MSKASILSGLSHDECVDPGGDVQLLAELKSKDKDICLTLQQEVQSLPCQLEWHESGDHFIIYVLGDKNADSDILLSALGQFVDTHIEHIQFIENRLVQDCSIFNDRHGFRFVDSEPAGDKEIVLLPGSHAFGSGSHPSTSLVLELLETLPEIPSPVLDVGCGTGILSLVAARLGAEQVVGIDIDREAVEVATSNARANHLDERATFSTSSLNELQGKFSLVLANLTGSVLFRLLADISDKADRGSLLIVSGFQGRQGNDVEKKAADYGWKIEAQRSFGKWQSRLFVKT